MARIDAWGINLPLDKDAAKVREPFLLDRDRRRRDPRMSVLRLPKLLQARV